MLASSAFALYWFPAVLHGPMPVMSLAMGVLVLGQLSVWAARWIALPRMRHPQPIPPPKTLRVAAVTTFVPSHEPLDMLSHTLRAMVAMHGAHDTWLLDEGDDAHARALCEELGVRHFSRYCQTRYNTDAGIYAARTKYGNYNAWLDAVGYATYDVLATFDTDHVPEVHYLTRVLGYFDDSHVAFVQPAQVYGNQEASFVAQAAAEETYGYYSSQLMASYALGHTVVIGSHCTHWLPALSAVGGFPPHDAEDLLLTMVYNAAGWQGVYVPEVLATGTTPASWIGYLQQQLRWSRSILELKVHQLPRIAGDLGVLAGLFNLFHGAYYLRALALPLVFATLAYALLVGTVPGFLAPGAIVALGCLSGTLGLIGAFRQRYYLVPERERGVHWRGMLVQFAKWPTFLRAVWEAVCGTRRAYVITRKDGRGPRHLVLAPTQLAFAATMSAAWGLGTVRNGSLPLVLTLVTAVIVFIAVSLAWYEVLVAPTEDRGIPADSNGTPAERRGGAA